MPATPKCNTYAHVNATSDGRINNKKKKNTHASKIEKSDDDFIPQHRVTKQCVDFSSSEGEYCTQNKTAKVVITEMLPDNSGYKFMEVFEHDHTGSYHCTFRMKLQSEEDARKWVADYTEKTK